MKTHKQEVKHTDVFFCSQTALYFISAPLRSMRDKVVHLSLEMYTSLIKTSKKARQLYLLIYKAFHTRWRLNVLYIKQTFNSKTLKHAI